MYLRAMQITIIATVVVLFIACGYKPSSKFSRDILGEKISTSVKISAQDPANTVIIKDAIDKAIVEVFRASLTDRVHSDAHLILNIENPRYTPVQYNVNGYVIAYRMSLVLNITRYHNGISKEYRTRGTYDFSVAPNAVVTDQERFEAIKNSAQKAIQSFIAKVSAEGARSKE